jgi:hypothetical protein
MCKRNFPIHAIEFGRNLSVREARDMFTSTLKWRKTFDIEAVMKEEFPQDVFGSLGHIYGTDKEGRPIVSVETQISDT